MCIHILLKLLLCHFSARSRVSSLVCETVNGMHIIQTLGKENHFFNMFASVLDKHTMSWYMYENSSSAFELTTMLLNNGFLMIMYFIIVIFHKGIVLFVVLLLSFKKHTIISIFCKILQVTAFNSSIFLLQDVRKI